MVKAGDGGFHEHNGGDPTNHLRRILGPSVGGWVHHFKWVHGIVEETRDRLADFSARNFSYVKEVRLLAEYLDPLRRFREEHVQDTVVFFGSARTMSRERAERALRALEHDPGLRADDEAVARARRALDWSRYYEDARALAHQLTAWTATL